jgi:LacI family transcriptional regulator
MASIIEEIAKALNVSSASVSRALNDRPGVSAALRENILAKAQELNYTPSIAARGLATQQSFGIGFFVREKPDLPTHTDPFYGEILHGVEQTIAQTNYHVTIATLTTEILAKPDDFRFVRERRVDGMILAGPDIPNDFIIGLRQLGAPIVLVDNCLAYSPVTCVNSADVNGAYMGARYLLELGHKDIGVIAGPAQWASNAHRITGYRQAVKIESRLELPVVHVNRTTIESGRAAYQQIIGEHPELTAICAVNDSMAIGAIRAAQAEGKTIPQDLSIIGFDDISWAQLNDPPLTTINIPKHQMGQEAAHRLLALLSNPELSPTEVMVSVQLVTRESSDVPNMTK